jgi:hypothetical protein
MRLHDKYGVRLNSKNFRKANSSAALNIDYDEKLKIIEIEFVNNGVYHYLNATNKEWNKFIEFSNKGKGLGEYLNQIFKKKHDFYSLIIV